MAASSCSRQLPPSLPPIPAIQQLSRAIVRVVAPNPGVFTLQGTNTYLVGIGGGNNSSCILIDTGEGRQEYIARLERAMRIFRFQSISAILLTHRHPDHIGGVDNVRRRFGPHIPVYKRLCSCGKHRQSDRDDFIALQEDFELEVSQTLPDSPNGLSTFSPRLSVIFTAGHTCDHVCFLFDQGDHQGSALFSGDCVLGSGSSTVFDCLTQYMRSLQDLLALDPHPHHIYPGHGEMVENAVEMIQQIYQHRLDREQQILHAVQCADKAVSADEIVQLVFGGNLVPELLIAACRSVRMHLHKLVLEGKIELNDSISEDHDNAAFQKSEQFRMPTDFHQ